MTPSNFHRESLRSGFGMVLAIIAVVALLCSQAGLVVHALEHLTKSGVRGAAPALSSTIQSVQTDPAKSTGDGVCAKCLDGAAHTTALTGAASSAFLPGAQVLASPVLAAKPPEGADLIARQRGPPSLSL